VDVLCVEKNPDLLEEDLGKIEKERISSTFEKVPFPKRLPNCNSCLENLGRALTSYVFKPKLDDSPSNLRSVIRCASACADLMSSSCFFEKEESVTSTSTVEEDAVVSCVLLICLVIVKEEAATAGVDGLLLQLAVLSTILLKIISTSLEVVEGVVAVVDINLTNNGGVVVLASLL
jgi:hypothetical protein